MCSPLVMLLFIIVMLVNPTKASKEENSSYEQHGNLSSIQPRESSFTVNLDARSIRDVTIQTPRFPKNYPSRSQVIWNVKGSCDIELYCSFFELRPRNNNGKCRDYLEIEDGVHTNKYCGEELNGKSYISYTTNIDLTFKSKKNGRYSGFNCSISCYNPTCYCGENTVPVDDNGKIVGGSTARENQYPWQAVIVWTGTATNDRSGLICGGSIINNQWILTAAHCTEVIPQPSDAQVFLGAYCWDDQPPGLVRLDIVDIVQHAHYNSTTLDNDIALLKLSTTIDFYHGHTLFRPVCLPINNTDPIPDEDNVAAAISGFGTLASGGDLPDCLQYAIVDTITNEKCQEKYGPSEPITENMICAEYPGRDSCQGDSGGPMMTNASFDLGYFHYYVQIGIVSWGIDCAHPDYPGVYARVSSYIDWINDNTQGSKTCPHPNY